MSTFIIQDNKSGETFEVHNNKVAKKISVYRDGELFCNSTVRGHMMPCENPPKKGHCIVTTDGTISAMLGCGIKSFAKDVRHCLFCYIKGAKIFGFW